MSELTPEKAREILELPYDEQADCQIGEKKLVAQGYLKCDAQLKSLIEGLVERIENSIQCLTSGNSVRVSDPRPALEYLKEALTLIHKTGFENKKGK